MRNVTRLLLAMALVGLFVPQLALGQTVIRFWDTADPRRDVIRDQVWAEFEAKHPGVKVEFEGIPFGQMQERILTAAAGNMLPDAVRFTGAPAFANLGIALELDRFVTPAHKAQFFDWVWSESNYYDGRTYGYPWSAYILSSVFYNKAIFRDNGLAFPEDTWTWDDFAAYNLKMQRRDGAGNMTTYGADLLGGANTSIGVLSSMMWSQGYEFLNKAGNRVNLNSPQGQTALGTIVSLVDSGMGFNHGAEAWLTGQTGMTIDQSGFLRQFARHHGLYANLDYGYANLPGYGGQEPILPVSTADSFVIFRTSRQPDLAWELIQTYQQPKWIAMIQRDVLVGNVTPFKAALDVPANEYHQFIFDDPDILKIMQSLNSGRFQETIPFWHISGAEIRDAWMAEIEAAVHKRKSVQQALQDAETRINRIMAQDRHRY